MNTYPMQVNPQFGTADDLKALVQACHQRDIWVGAVVASLQLFLVAYVISIPDILEDQDVCIC